MASNTVYRQHGIVLEVPSGWELDEQGDEHGDVTISISDGAAFWSLTLMWDRPEVERVLDEARQAFEHEYEEIDIADKEQKVSRRDAQGYDIEFVCMELINHAALRCFRTGRFTAFLMHQATDHELKYYAEVFQEITDSLDVDQDGSILIG